MPVKPNILFYFSDQQRADTCGCYGQELPVTPCLDILAREGVRFEKAFTAQPVCGPARALFQTGLYPTDTGCFRNNIALPSGVKTIAEYMTEAGYETAYVGKWHLASHGELECAPSIDYQRSAIPVECRGGYRGFWRAADLLEFTSNGYGGYVFDENMNRIDFSGFRADCMTDFALEFLRSRQEDQPFFLTVSQLEPHHQNDAGHYQGPPDAKQRFSGFTLPGDLEALGGDARQEYPDYLGACAQVDAGLGRIVETLKELGLYENTVIIYTSDHGSHFRTRNDDSHLAGYDDYKRTCHDAALHVPLVIRGTGFTGGKVVPELVSIAGIPRTILALAGIEVPENMAGENLKDLVHGDTAGRENEVFVQISESRVGRAIRTSRYTYAVCAPGKNGGLYMNSDTYVDDFLYDLETDPYQLENLVGDSRYEKQKEELRSRLRAWIAKVERQSPRIVS